MRRFLKRSSGVADGTKSANRRRRLKRSTSFQADGDGDVGVDTERLPVSEPHSGADSSDKQLTGKSRSLSRHFDRRKDSGCEVGLEATGAFGLRRRRGAMMRQDGMMSSNSVISPASSTSFERFCRQRNTLRSFRARSQKFVRRRMRPRCLRPAAGDCSDDAYGPAQQSTCDSGVAVGSWLSTSITVSTECLQQWLPDNDVVEPSRTRQSSGSDATTLPSSADASVSNDPGSSLESPMSAHFPAFCHVQV